MAVRVAVIGSFKQFYDDVLATIEAFRKAGWFVASPAGSAVIEPGIDFVRFETDAEADTDPLVQTRTLVNILGADLTYVIAPSGYVGRTTCYEIGRVIHARKPLYISEAIADLPIQLEREFVVSPAELIARIGSGGDLKWPFEEGDGPLPVLERRLVDGA